MGQELDPASSLFLYGPWAKNVLKIFLKDYKKIEAKNMQDVQYVSHKACNIHSLALYRKNSLALDLD